jgi:hypothetical protein
LTSSNLRSTAPAVGAVASLALGIVLMLLYPGPRAPLGAAAAIVLAVTSLCASGWLVVIPAVLPIASFAPYTGSMYVEEFDVIVAAALCGKYAQLALPLRERLPCQPAHASPRGSALRRRTFDTGLACIALLAVSYALGMARGFDLVSLSALSTASDYSPANALRVGKGFLLALLALPALLFERRRSGSVVDHLGSGLALGLLTVGLVALWERVAFLDLFDMAADYRVTALFWEMHVGGAALDGFLALTFPFALWYAMRVRRGTARVAATLLVALGAYTVVVTFSRALYVAIALATMILAVGLLQAPKLSSTARTPRAHVDAAVIIALASSLAPIFVSGGYRALAAVWLALGALFFAGGIPAMSSTLRAWRAVAWSGAVLLALAAIAFAYHWRGPMAARTSGVVLLVGFVVAGYSARARQPLWMVSRQTLSLAIVAGIVASFAGLVLSSSGAAARFATIGEDLGDRMNHWRTVVDLAVLHRSSSVLGVGVGSFPETYLLGSRALDSPGTFSLLSEETPPAVRLGGPQQVVDWGELLRFGQIVPARAGDAPFVLTFEARSQRKGNLLLQICQRDILYEAACVSATTGIVNADGAWHPLRVPLAEGQLPDVRWYAPRSTFFSVADMTPNHRVDVRELVLIASDGSRLLRNGDFAAGTVGWFFTSDRSHLPWHAKNLWLGAWFDQGWLGLVALALLVTATLWRAWRATRAGVGTSLPVFAGLVAFVVVGAFDSLLDVPRLAFLFFLTAFAACFDNDAGAPAVVSRAHRAVR